MRQLLFIIATLCCSWIGAATLPTASTADNPVWYMIKFINGGAVLEAKTDGAQVATASQSASAAQFWRFEGSASAGYKIVSRSGMTLYTNTTAVNGMFSAASAPASNSLFAIKACTLAGYTDGFLLSPKTNSGVYMNQWGGAGTGKQLGLWNAVDANCPVAFISEAEYEEGMKLASIPLVPMPTDIKLVEGGAQMKDIATIVYPTSDYAALAQQYADMLGAISGRTLATRESALGAQGAPNTVTLTIDANIVGDEAYRLAMAQSGNIVVSASQAHGFFNALQTLRQLFYDAKYNSNGALRLVDVTDKPLFGYRGFMLDIARHYFDKEEVKKLLDVMALYKVNKFHWHLTDDQGWRIEIPEYPLLTEIGAVRASSNAKPANPRFYDDTEYGRGMYYTLDDLREVVAYATKLHIDIMPEIDLPGHMVAAISSYPEEFSCNPARAIENDGKYIVRVNEGVSKDVLNVAKPEVMAFLKCVLAHMAEIFPYPVIHIGGDECPTQAWTNRVNANDQQFLKWMNDNGLATVNDIQPWLVNELGKWLKEKYGKDVVCWNELTGHWKSSYETKPIIMCYSDYGQNAMKAATNLGLRTIYTGCWPFYLDMYQTYQSNIYTAAAHQFDDCYTGGYGNNTLQRVYEATPLSNIGGKENLCLGVGANLWTESVNNNKEAEHQFFPRMLALAEVGWLQQNQKNWPSFRQRVQTHFKVLGEMGVNYATYDLDPTPATGEPNQAGRAEAERLLADAHPDAVGYPSAEAYNALRQALSAYNANMTEATGKELASAVAAFKKAPIAMPSAQKTYRIVSASVAWGVDYAGSTMYLTNDAKRFRFHYTPQNEPEELFRFAEVNGGFTVYSRLGNRGIYLGSIDSKVTAGASATQLRIDAPTVASTAPAYFDYVPGMVLISAKNGYSTNASTTKRLNAQADGYVYVKSSAVVGHTGCWRIVEVTDFAAELQALVDKCSRLDILHDEIVVPASDLLLSGTTVTEDEYDTYAIRYAEHLGLKFEPTAILTPLLDAQSADAANATSLARYDLSGRPVNDKGAVGVVVTANRKTLTKN